MDWCLVRKKIISGQVTITRLKTRYLGILLVLFTTLQRHFADIFYSNIILTFTIGNLIFIAINCFLCLVTDKQIFLGPQIGII